VYIFTREKLKGKRNGVIRAKVECIYKAKEIENERERERERVENTSVNVRSRETK
jgi:hypothetical protein